MRKISKFSNLKATKKLVEKTNNAHKYTKLPAPSKDEMLQSNNCCWRLKSAKTNSQQQNDSQRCSSGGEMTRSNSQQKTNASVQSKR